MMRLEAVSFGYLPDQPVLQNVSFALQPGELVALVGPTGCGKTTLLHLLAGFLRPTGGRVWCGDKELQQPGRDILCMFQDAAVFPWMRVLENVMFGGVSAGAAQAMLERVGLENHLNAFPNQLSGGQKQRLQLARLLVMRPQVLLLDEPFGALDWFTRHQLRRELEQIWQQDHLSMVLITHDLDEAIGLADRVLLLHDHQLLPALSVDIPRPRDPGDPAWASLRTQLLQQWPTPTRGPC